MAALHQRTEDLEVKLKGVRLVLQEKVQQLKEEVGSDLDTTAATTHGSVTDDHFLQLVKGTKWSRLLKDLYVENSQLMVALQVTEQRQKDAEKNNVLLEAKVMALNKLLRDLVPAALAT